MVRHLAGHGRADPRILSGTTARKTVRKGNSSEIPRRTPEFPLHEFLRAVRGHAPEGRKGERGGRQGIAAEKGKPVAGYAGPAPVEGRWISPASVGRKPQAWT